MAASEPRRAFVADPYDYGEARRIVSELGLAEPIAVTLVRRGYRSVESARDFLEAQDEHDPSAFEGMGEAAELALAHARRGARVTVHGDYDVDGVCSTSILVATLRALGAVCDWFIPDRRGDGYGLTMGSVSELQRRGSELVITVDCGIGSAAEVAALRGGGTEVIVSDHHELPAAEERPDCPLIHPALGYPFSALCGAGVAHKLSLALRRTGGLEPEGRDELDLVALATVADMVPLIGENRRLVRQGLRFIRSAPRVGMRALMARSRVAPESASESDLSFRLAPRINAAGRLYRADAGVELMLCEQADRAEAIAEELDRANSERRAVERRVADEAEAARAALPLDQAEAPALVLAGEGWHPGVVGIAASRLADRHWRPVVLLALDGDRVRGSARSIPGFDLIRALDACAGHLERHGGHRAAAGLELRRQDLEAFRRDFVAHAAAVIDPGDLVRTERIDALVGVGREGIGMDLAEQLERLAPFGQGNPDPRLVVPCARLRSIRPLGEQGKHSRFDLESGSGRALGVAFGLGGELSAREGEPLDISVRLEVDRWNGSVQPRVILRDLYPLGGVDAEGPPCAAGSCPAPEQLWWERFEAELARADERFPVALGRRAAEGPRREAVERRGGAALAALAELVSSGESVLALCADASRRRALAGSAVDPRRFGAAREPLLACCRCGDAGLDAALGSKQETEGGSDAAEPGLVLADWGALARRPSAARRFAHVVMVDPPPFSELERMAGLGRSPQAGGPGYLHTAWGPAEVGLAANCLTLEWEPRGPVSQIWRLLARSDGEAAGAELLALLAGPGAHPRTPEVAARSVAVLEELELCEWGSDRGARRLRVVSSERTQLERSRAYGACVARHEEGKRLLQGKAPSS